MDDQHRPSSPDRRGALKARHRRAIVDAAAALMTETGGIDFTVDQLAERADVSRRTVFNHFATMDDIVLEVFGGMIETVSDSIDANMSSRTAGRPGTTSMFDQVTAALRGTDLVTPIVELTRIFGGLDASPTPRQAVLFERAIREAGSRISAATLRHYPSADPFEVEVMCGALLSGVLVVHRHWEESAGGVDTQESRRVWGELLDRLITIIRSAYGAHTSDHSTS